MDFADETCIFGKKIVTLQPDTKVSAHTSHTCKTNYKQ